MNLTPDQRAESVTLTQWTPARKNYPIHGSVDVPRPPPKPPEPKNEKKKKRNRKGNVI